MDIFQGWADQALMLGITTTRFATAFAVMPIMAQDTVPATVRNSIFVSFGLIVLVMVPPVSVAGLTPGQWMILFGKEAFIGIVIGYFFATVLWSMEVAGNYIDTKVGATMAQTVDPLSGHQTSLSGSFMSRLANYAFIAAGGLLVLVGTVLQSYALWPIDQTVPSLKGVAVTIFTDEFSRLMIISLLVSSPALLVLFCIDLGMGLLNRFAQQLNVFSLAMSIKSWASLFIITMMMMTIVQLVVEDLATQNNRVLTVINNLTKPEKK
jgi:type III secretion protein T